MFFGSSMEVSKLYIVSFQGGLIMLKLQLMTTSYALLWCPCYFEMSFIVHFFPGNNHGTK